MRAAEIPIGKRVGLPQCISFVSYGKGNNSKRCQSDWIDVFPSLAVMNISPHNTIGMVMGQQMREIVDSCIC